MVSDAIDENQNFDALVVGAGFGGLYMLHRLRQSGMRVRLLERGSGVGGTWYWNRYPGARCDVPSIEYSYSFSEQLQQEWEWTERYASQPEILSYLEHVADRFQLRDDIQFDTSVEAMQYDEASNRWQVTTSRGEFHSQFCIMATGCLSAPNVPDIPGLEEFTGRRLHTGMWPREQVDLSGQRVGIIGTGSSAVQSLPEIAKQAEDLYLFQRTPNFSIPAQNRPLAAEETADIKSRYAQFRRSQRATAAATGPPPNDLSALEATPEQRQQIYEQRWEYGGVPFVGAFSDLLFNAEASRTAMDFVKHKIQATVSDPATAELLCPEHHISCKRLCADSGYYQSFNRDNVHLVDLKSDPIEAVNNWGLKTKDNAYPLDTLILATGFDAMTGALNRIDIRGKGGRSLKKQWSERPGGYLGLAIAGFPNLFMMTGPGSPSVFANMVLGVEQHAEWISACLDHLRVRGIHSIEAEPEFEQRWMEEVKGAASESLFHTCDSWFLGSNIPGKPRVFLTYMGGFNTYEAVCNEVARDGYRGFVLSS